MSLFSGEVVRLAPVTRDDLEPFARWFSDPEFLRFMRPDVLKLMSYEDEVEWYEAMRKQKDHFGFAVRTLEDDTLIGSTGLFGFDWRSASAEFGIGIGEKAYWGRGYGTDATRLVVGYAFGELNLNRVQLEVYDFNARAIKSYEKVGFVYEGIRRQALFRESQYHDIHVMSLLREDWHSANTEG